MVLHNRAKKWSYILFSLSFTQIVYQLSELLSSKQYTKSTIYFTGYKIYKFITSRSANPEKNSETESTVVSRSI